MEYRCKMPVLLLFFNRPAHAAAVLERVRMVAPPLVYVHCDGPRPAVSGEAEQVAAVRDVVAGIDWDCEVITLYREENMGLRKGVHDALNWFFKQEEMGIVIEDDCLPDPSFFPYCEELLQRYRNEPKVMHIAGSNIAERISRHNIESYIFSKMTFVWGWASWRRAWAKMSLTLEGLEEFKAEKQIATLTEDNMTQVYVLDKFDVTSQNRNNSWAFAWFYSILKNGGGSIVPSVNLVQNTGIGLAGATHTSKKDERASIVAGSMKFPLIHPTTIQSDRTRDREIFYLSQKSRWRLLLWFILKKAGLR